MNRVDLLAGITILVGMTLIGCHLFVPQTETDPNTGEVTVTRDSPAVEIGRDASEVFGPYGELVLAGAMLIQNAYLLYRKRKARARKTNNDPAPIAGGSGSNPNPA